VIKLVFYSQIKVKQDFKLRKSILSKRLVLIMQGKKRENEI